MDYSEKYLIYPILKYIFTHQNNNIMHEYIYNINKSTKINILHIYIKISLTKFF